MDTQIATHSSGRIHAVSCVQSDQDAWRFRTVMERQGFKVERLSQVAAAVRFAQPTRPATALERPAQVPLPEPGTQIQFKVDQQTHVGTVAAVLRWPTNHPHCSSRVALLVRSPDWEGLIEPHAALSVTEMQHPATSAESLALPVPLKRPAVSQPGLW